VIYKEIEIRKYAHAQYQFSKNFLNFYSLEAIIMSILISGDFHANASKELLIITKEALIKKYQQDKYESINYHIILGDAGFLWPGNEKHEAINFWALSQRPFPVLCVVGNHDPVLGRSDLPEVDIGIGEKVIMIKNTKPIVAYLKRGKVYNLENHKFLVLGGALSIDKEIQQDNNTWWKQEYWSKTEETKLFNMIKKDNHFDYVVSHTGPNRINETIDPLHKVGLLPWFFDEVAALNEKIDCKITCKQWFCGHWHRDHHYYCKNLNRGYQYLYKKTALLEGDEIIVK